MTLMAEQPSLIRSNLQHKRLFHSILVENFSIKGTLNDADVVILKKGYFFRCRMRNGHTSGTITRDQSSR